MANSKFTFKTTTTSGRYGSFYPDYHAIKIKKKEVGNITDSFPHRINLMVYKDETLKNWDWIQLAKTFESIKEAKEWLNSEGKFEAINQKYKLRHEE